MLRRLTNMLGALVLTSASAFAWGGYEHTVIAYAAQEHLTGNAERNIRYYLDQPIYEYAEWMDWIPIQAFPEYEITRTGHCSVMWSDGSIARTPAIEDGQGDGFGCMERVIETLKNHRNLPDSLVALHLRYFIHLMGDFHCPGHIIVIDKPETGTTAPVSLWKGNPIWKKIYYKNTANKKTIHWLWDTPLQNMHGEWTYEQWRRELDVWTPEQCREAVKGSLEDWFKGNSMVAGEVLSFTKPETVYSESYYEGRSSEIAYRQIRLAICRMAAILNDCFDYE